MPYLWATVNCTELRSNGLIYILLGAHHIASRQKSGREMNLFASFAEGPIGAPFSQPAHHPLFGYSNVNLCPIDDLPWLGFNSIARREFKKVYWILRQTVGRTERVCKWTLLLREVNLNSKLYKAIDDMSRFLPFFFLGAICLLLWFDGMPTAAAVNAARQNQCSSILFYLSIVLCRRLH